MQHFLFYGLEKQVQTLQVASCNAYNVKQQGVTWMLGLFNAVAAQKSHLQDTAYR